MTDSLWYPSVDDVLDIHEAIVSEYPDTSSGVQNRGEWFNMPGSPIYGGEDVTYGFSGAPGIRGVGAD